MRIPHCQLAGILSALLIAHPCLAAELKAPAFQVQTRHKANTLEVEAVPPARHHFNVKAPMKIFFGGSGGSPAGSSDSFKPVSATEQLILFKLPITQLPSKASDGTVSLYLCDDPNTFCERHDSVLRWDPPMKDDTTHQKSKGQSKDPVVMPVPVPSQSKKSDAGFILNDPAKALALAAKERKPLLIDFFGIWCPPCNQLDAEVFSNPQFAKVGSRFVLLKLDADAEASWEMKARYRVGGYPTVIFASREGEEIHRVVGFSGKDAFMADIEKAWGLRESPVLATGDAERLGLFHLERKEYDLAKRHLLKVPGQRESLLAAEIGVLEEKLTVSSEGKAAQLRKDLLTLLEKATTEFPNTVDSLERRLRLAELLSEEVGNKNPQKRTAALKEAVLLSEKLLKGEAPLKKGYQESDVLQLLAETHGALGDSASAKKTWQRAAESYVAKIRSDEDRGHQLERAYCLWKSGDFESAEKLYRKLEKNFPSEFTFHYAHAAMNLERKDIAGAVTEARAALERSYGDNRLRAAHLLARTLRADGKSGEARSVIEATLAAAKRPADEKLRTARYLKNLEKLKSELN